MTIRQHLHLIPTTLVLGLSLLATVPAQSEGIQEQPPSETINSQTRLENNLKAVIAHYLELENQLSKASTQAEAKTICDTMLRKMPEDLQRGEFISQNFRNIPLKEQKRILTPYRDQMQNLDTSLSLQFKRLGFKYQSVDTESRQRGALDSFSEEWERLVQQYPEESDAAALFQQYLERLNNNHKLLSSIQTPNDRQRIEKTIAPDRRIYSRDSGAWINELQTMLQKLPIETQKRLYLTYLTSTQISLPLEKVSGQYHYLVYQSEPLLQYLALRYDELYTLKKAMENLMEQSPDMFPGELPEKEILIQQNYMLTNQLSGLLSTATGKAAAAAIGPRALDLQNRLLANRELLICADDVSPEERARIDREYGQSIQQATDKLNIQVQRLLSKNGYRNYYLSVAIEELDAELNPQPKNNASPVAEQTEETQPEPES